MRSQSLELYTNDLYNILGMVKKAGPIIQRLQSLFISNSLPCLHSDRIKFYYMLCMVLIKHINHHRLPDAISTMKEIMISLLLHFKSIDVDDVSQHYL